MKKLAFGLLLGLCLAACNNKSTDKNVDANSAPVSPGIDNVDGNIPDTSRAIRLNHPLPKDSTLVEDSTHH